MNAPSDNPGASASTTASEPAAAPRRRRFPGEHGLFAAALVVALAVRVVVMAAFRPGFIYGDAHTYLTLAADLQPHPDRVVGYGAILKVITIVTDDTWVVAGVQHLLGLLTATLGYALLRRWGVGAIVATAAVLPVLFDAMQLVLEHSVLSDVVYDFVLLLGVVLLAWRPTPTAINAVLGGLVLGVSVLVRVSGEPVVLAAVGFCLIALATWRERLLVSVVLVVAFAAPLAGYAGWFHSQNGSFALTTSGGRALYMRTTTFVDCAHLRVPSYERRLCPSEPVGHRKDPTYYGWHHPDLTAGLRPPAGVSVDDAFRDFARRAIKAQPGAYLHVVLRDAVLPLSRHRDDAYDYDTAAKWQFETWATYRPSTSATPLYDEYGGPYRTSPGLADFLTRYGTKVYLWGPLTGLLALVALVGLVWPGRPRGTRAVAFLALALGVGLPLVPVVTAEFVWRYELPAVLLLPMAAALAWSRRPATAQAERTLATPSTD